MQRATVSDAESKESGGRSVTEDEPSPTGAESAEKQSSPTESESFSVQECDISEDAKTAALSDHSDQAQSSGDKVVEKCAVCLDTVENRAEMQLTPCGHCFHKNCISRWLNRAFNCPLCRCPIDADGRRRRVSSVSSSGENRYRLVLQSVTPRKIVCVLRHVNHV